MSRVITVGMADCKTAKAPDTLATIGLGSCIGICIYDPVLRLGGMVHIMLPSVGGNLGKDPAKYADSGLELLLKEVLGMGAAKIRLKAKIAGGAQMFAFPGSPVLKIGERNAEAVEQGLKKHGVHLIAAEVGGTFGRTIYFDVGTGALRIRTIHYGEKVI